MTTRILALVRDLVLRSRIEAAAEAAGADVAFAANYDRLRTVAAAAPVSMVFADLSDAAFNPATTVQELKAACPEATLIGFASHVDLKPLAAARSAGFAQTLSRSEFVSRLPELLTSANRPKP